MRIFAVAFVALALAACQPGYVPPIGAAPAPVTLCSGPALAGSLVIDEKALYAAEALYNVPTHAYVTANANKQLSPALKARIKPLLQRAYVSLKLARAAYAVGDANGFNCQYAAVLNFANQAKAILPAK